MKFLKVLCVIALVFAVSATAYAETQSVKVSGDITMRAFARNQYDLCNDTHTVVYPISVAAGAGNDDGTISSTWGSFLQSTAEVQIDADLTDNVGGCIRLINQRVWGSGNYFSEASSMTGQVALPYDDSFTSAAVAPSSADAFEVAVDLAYIELKEFLYSPLTLRIGRQDLWFGKGFIVGASQMDPTASLFAREYTAINSFDAVRATLDYSPWTIDGVFAKIQENALRADDDVNLWGVNVGYVFDEYNAEAESYFWYKNRRFSGQAATGENHLISVSYGHSSDDVYTFGGRGSFDPIEDWTIAAEGAYQFGDYLGQPLQAWHRSRSAFAVDASVECRYFQEEFAWRPVASLEYILYSGEDNLGEGNPNRNGTYTGWDYMYRGKFDTAIREFQNVYYRTLQRSSPSNTNQHQFLARGTIEPTDSITIDATYAQFWLDKRWSNAMTNTNVGGEFDFKVTWDYTEDVSFNFLSGWFFPGQTFNPGKNAIATDIVGTVKLSF